MNHRKRPEQISLPEWTDKVALPKRPKSATASRAAVDNTRGISDLPELAWGRVARAGAKTAKQGGGEAEKASANQLPPHGDQETPDPQRSEFRAGVAATSG